MELSFEYGIELWIWNLPLNMEFTFKYMEFTFKYWINL